MTLPRLSFHAHLRRVRRIYRAENTLLNEWVNGTREDIDETFDHLHRLEKLARRQFNDSRAKRGN